MDAHIKMTAVHETRPPRCHRQGTRFILFLGYGNSRYQRIDMLLQLAAHSLSGLSHQAKEQPVTQVPLAVAQQQPGSTASNSNSWHLGSSRHTVRTLPWLHQKL